MNVTIRCLCPQKNGEVRHPEGDTVVLRDRMGLRGILAIQNDAAIIRYRSGGAVSMGLYLAAITEGYLYQGIESWTLKEDGLDERGRPAEIPIEVNYATIEQYLVEGDLQAAMEVGEAADVLYGEQVTIPLLAAVAKSSQPSSTSESTSQTTDGPSPAPMANRSARRSRKSARRSKPSSITPIRTGVTETTSSSLDGDSSLSPSSASAA